MNALTAAGVPATPRRTLADARADDYARERGLVVEERHPAFGAIEHGGTPQRLSETPARAGTSPVFGGDTDEVLSELGLLRNRR